MAPKGRHTKSKARISQYESLLKELGKEKLKDLQIYIPPGPRLGDVVVKAENITKAFGENVLFKDLSFEIPEAQLLELLVQTVLVKQLCLE